MVWLSLRLADALCTADCLTVDVTMAVWDAEICLTACRLTAQGPWPRVFHWPSIILPHTHREAHLDSTLLSWLEAEAVLLDDPSSSLRIAMEKPG